MRSLKNGSNNVTETGNNVTNCYTDIEKDSEIDKEKDIETDKKRKLAFSKKNMKSFDNN